MNSIWQMWARDISPTTCNKIIQECEQLPPMEAAVGGQSVNAVDSKVRKSERIILNTAKGQCPGKYK